MYIKITSSMFLKNIERIQLLLGGNFGLFAGVSLLGMFELCFWILKLIIVIMFGKR